MPGQPTAVVVTLGCAKNLVDSEHMLGLLARAGFHVGAAADAGEIQDKVDLLLVNTCGFVEAAKAESVDAILRLGEIKTRGDARALIVAGCLGQRYADELMAEVPEIDAVIGTGDFPRIAEVAAAVLRGKKQVLVGNPVYRYDLPLPRLRTTPTYSAYLKIAEGCDHTCSFCVIPRLRGAYRSRPMREILREAEEMAGAGVKELNLISQDCTVYGRDLEDKPRLAELLRGLNGIGSLRWIRLLYNYPTSFTPDLPRAMAELEKVCRYVDIPLQHGSDRILRSMGRGEGRARLLRLIASIRAGLPDAVFRSSFIVGYPGEEERDFADLLSFLEEIRFDHVGFFTYSPEEGTPAARLPYQVADEVKEERYHRAMERQRLIAWECQQRHAGKTVEVLVEEALPGEAGYFRGRWRGQAPEVDGQVILAAAGLQAGEIVPVKITRAEEYDLLGEAGS